MNLLFLLACAECTSEVGKKICENIKENTAFIEHHLCYFNTFAVCLFVMIIWVCFIHKEGRKRFTNHLMLWAIGVFGVGSILYAIGFFYEGTEGNLVALVLRSAIASMEMFVSESELIEIHAACKENPIYMLLFALTHFLAVSISAAFIIHILGIRVRSFINMRFLFKKKKKDVFVFFDLSKESVSLAKDIYRTRVSVRNPSCCFRTRRDSDGFQIIFVKMPLEGEHLERFSFSHILNLAGNRDETVEELDNMNAFLTYSRKSVAIDRDEKEWAKSVGLNNLQRYLNNCSGKKYFFCLSSNEENNINTAVALSKHYCDAENIYYRASQDSITETFSSPNLRAVNSASLSILELKKNVEYHPVSFVNPDTKTGVATKPFRAMIVGFGKTGFEAFRFLYEFSAFVGKDVEENPFYCDIIDPKAKHLENALYLHCPSLEECKGEDCNNTSSKITFHEGTIESKRDKVVELIKVLDYIVVCTDSEKANLSIGITLLELAYKYRAHSEKLSIFIGINDDKEFDKAQEIAQYYNKKRNKKTDVRFFAIIPFGTMKKLFTCENIIDNETLEKAQKFYYEYEKLSGVKGAEYKCAKEAWEARRKKHTMNGEDDTEASDWLWMKNKLAQQEFQDMANAWHIQTKLRLVGACDDDTRNVDSQSRVQIRRAALLRCIESVMEQLKKEKKEEDEKFDSYGFIQEHVKEYEMEHGISAGEYQTLFANLAKCEHLRWYASNRMLGYAKGNERHYLRKTHCCMVANEELIRHKNLRDTIRFDYNTILVSLMMYERDEVASKKHSNQPTEQRLIKHSSAKH